MKIFEGTIISIGTGNTAVVEVYSKIPHPLYKKLIKRSKKYKVDFTDFKPELGQKVRIAETRPISKDKYFKISEIVDLTKTKKALGQKTKESKPADSKNLKNNSKAKSAKGKGASSRKTAKKK